MGGVTKVQTSFSQSSFHNCRAWSMPTGHCLGAFEMLCPVEIYKSFHHLPRRKCLSAKLPFQKRASTGMNCAQINVWVCPFTFSATSQQDQWTYNFISPSAFKGVLNQHWTSQSDHLEWLLTGPQVFQLAFGQRTKCKGDCWQYCLAALQQWMKHVHYTKRKTLQVTQGLLKNVFNSIIHSLILLQSVKSRLHQGHD